MTNTETQTRSDDLFGWHFWRNRRRFNLLHNQKITKIRPHLEFIGLADIVWWHDIGKKIENVFKLLENIKCKKNYLYLAETILTSRVYRNHSNWILSFVFIAVKGFWDQDTSTPETNRLLDGVKKTRGWGPTVILGSTPSERRPPRTRTHGASSRETILPIR